MGRNQPFTERCQTDANQSQSSCDGNPEGTYTVLFAPTAAAGKEVNWVQTMPGKSWSALLRLYAPLEPWFEKTWKPGDITKMK